MNKSYPKSFDPRVFGIDRIAAVVAMLIGIVVLIGWTLDVEMLKRVIPTLVAMNPVTAVCFMLLSVAVWASHSEDTSPAARNVIQSLAVVVLLVGSLKLCEVMFGWFPGVDQIIFREKLVGDGTFAPNRIAPNTAFNFVLLSVALIFPWKRGRGWFDISTVLIVISIFGSSIPVIGYAFGTKALYGIGQFIPMALHSAFTFLMLGLGLLFARPERPIIASLLDNGMSGIMVRRLFPAVIGVPIILSWFRLEGQKLGLYDNELGAALVVVVQILLLSTIVWWISRVIRRLDKQRRQAEAQLGELVLTDDLTGLRNRRGFSLLAEQELKLAKNKRMGIVLWCLYADLDGLKQINDTLGHDAGSQAIVNTAAVLKSTFRDSDIIARLGGDEFSILAATNTLDGGNLLVERLQSNLDDFNARENLPYKLALSLGIVPIDTEDMLSLDQIVKTADAQMYLNKQVRKRKTQPDMSLMPSLA